VPRQPNFASLPPGEVGGEKTISLTYIWTLQQAGPLKRARFLLGQAKRADPNDSETIGNYIDTVIVFARSVTFHLQKQFAHVPGFEEWYEKQQLMKATRDRHNDSSSVVVRHDLYFADEEWDDMAVLEYLSDSWQRLSLL
jgi:hypothetical protein